MFVLGVVPALATIAYFYFAVSDSPTFTQKAGKATPTLEILKKHWRLTLYAILLMAAFNFFSHGTQDLYPTFLLKQRGFEHGTVGTIAVIYNAGAVLGGIILGSMS